MKTNNIFKNCKELSCFATGNIGNYNGDFNALGNMFRNLIIETNIKHSRIPEEKRHCFEAVSDFNQFIRNWLK